MITFFVILGILAFIGIVIALMLYVMDLPPREERYRIEQEAADAAWRIQEHTRRAVEQMLDAARRQRGPD